MAEYTYDFKEMDTHLANVKTQLGNEIASLNTQKESLAKELENLKSQLYYFDENGVRQINTGVQSKMSAISSAISQIGQRIRALKNCIQESESLITYIKESMGNIDDDYKKILDDIMNRMDTYTKHINEYIGGLDDGALSNNGAILYRPINEIKQLLDRNGAGVGSVSDATIREFQRRVVFDRFSEVDPSISGLNPQDIWKEIDKLIADTTNTPGVAAVLYYTLQDQNYLKNINVQDQNVQDIINQVTALQTYLGGNFPIIIGQGVNEVYFGGVQMWWNNSTIFGGSYYYPNIMPHGCGYAAATDILAALSLRNSEIAKKLGLGVLNGSGVATQAEYLKLMTDVYNNMGFHYFDKGIPSEELKGVVNSYLENHSCSSIEFKKHNGLDGRDWNGVPDPESFDKIWNEINLSISSGIPVTMNTVFSTHEMSLVYAAPSENAGAKNKNSKHFVNIIGTETYENGDRYMYVSSWGRVYKISYNEYVESFNPLANSLGVLGDLGFTSDNFYIPNM